MRRWIDLAAALALSAAALPAAAQDFGLSPPPRAASDWLAGKAPARPPATAWRPGDAVPPGIAPPPAASPRRPMSRTPGRGAVATSAAVPRVGVTRLSDGNPDTRGAVPAGAAGLPRDLWGPAPAADLAQAIAAAQPRLTATRALLARMLTAQLAPPTGSAAGDEGRLFLARIDRLIGLGLLPEAQALLLSAGAGDGDRFARMLDLALYEGDATAACRKMTERPGLAPGLAARVYCLAQAGDWAAAALTLHGARDESLIAPQTVALLERFLDDSSADLTDALPDPTSVTPLEFRLFEAIGQPLGTGPLPLAFAWADIDGSSGWKAQIEAAERLVRAGATDPARLAEAYLAQQPAASGGIWDRAGLYQQLDAALGSGDSAALAAALTQAEPVFAQAGLLPALARLIAPRLPSAGLDGAAAETAAHLRLLAGVPVPGAARLPDADRALVALAEDHPAPETSPAPLAPEGAPPPYHGPRFPEGSPGAAYAQALAAPPLPEPPAGGRGLALLRAIADVDAALDGDTARAASGLRQMTELGQRDVALQAAVELLLDAHLGGLRR